MENSFYQNVFLLTQAVAPSKDFLKYFKEGMFDKPNTIGFLHASHYLLTIYDAERFKKLLKWPLFCKQDETKYRTDVKDFLITVAHENPDVEFPQILASHLLHAGGSKFSNIMWSLSTVTLRTYIKRENATNLWAPKSGVAEDLSKMLLNNLIARSSKNIAETNARMNNGNEEAKAYAAETATLIQKYQEELFLTRRSLMDIAPQAPVHPAMKKRLADPNDVEVVQIWKKSIDESLSYLKAKQKRLREIAELSTSVSGMVSSIASTDSNILDGERLPNIETKRLSEIDGLAPETQLILHRLYVNDTISLEYLLTLINRFLTDYRRHVEKNGFPNLADCDTQIVACCEDMNSMINLFRATYQRITLMSNEIKNHPHRENEKNVPKDVVYHSMDNDIFDSVLLKSSPTININGNNEIERTDVHDRLELTPVENIHKTLFSRHKRNDDTTPQMAKLRPKLLVSRINFDDTRSSGVSERLLSPVNRTTSSRIINQSMTNRSGKYSHLFSTFQKKKGNRLNSSVSSVPGSWRNSTVADMSPNSDLYNISELRPHLITVEQKFIDNREMITPTKRTPTRRNEIPTSDKSDEKTETIPEVTISRTVIDETTELTIEMGRSPKIRQAEKSSDRNNRRASISDLVERYKRVREKTADVTAYLENCSDVSDESGRH